MAGHLKLNRGECQSRRFPPLALDSERVSVRYSVDDYVVDPAKAAGHSVGAFIPLSDRHHYRFDLQGTFGSGRHEFCGLSDGFFIMFSETAYHAPQSRFISSPESLQIFIASQGDGEFVPAGGRPLSFEAPSAALVIEPADAPPSEVTFAGQSRYIHMVVHRKALQALYAGGEQELDLISGRRDAVQGPLEDPCEGRVETLQGELRGPLQPRPVRPLGRQPLTGDRRGHIPARRPHIPRPGRTGPVAAFAPDGSLVAVLDETRDHARSLVVFAPASS